MLLLQSFHHVLQLLALQVLQYIHHCSLQRGLQLNQHDHFIRIALMLA